MYSSINDIHFTFGFADWFMYLYVSIFDANIMIFCEDLLFPACVLIPALIFSPPET
jgi:hypothetical protein